MAEVEDEIQRPENDVLTATVYKHEPECMNYAFKVRSKYEPGDVEHLEQLLILENSIKQMKKRAENAIIMKTMDISRDVRRTLLEERLKKEAEVADSGPTGGEPKPN
jgi:hypothetical protein